MAVDIVVSVAAKIGEYLVAPIGRQFSYLFCFNSNIDNLKNEVEKLERMRGGVQPLVEAAKRNIEIIRPDVAAWLNSVDDIKEVADEILKGKAEVQKGCLNGWCPSLKSRYLLSRKAKKKTQVVVDLRANGKDYPSRVSFPAPSVEIESTSAEDFMDFNSRTLTMEMVMDALKDDEFHMIGICGMGGAGKTSMVKQVRIKAKAENLFDEVVMAVVSQQPDLKKIQRDIGEWLDLKLDVENLSLRADRLRVRLKNIKRILIILDDVWERLPLEEVGIPFGRAHEGCKIMLTSRSQDVCTQMGTQKNITVEVLREEEAWNLFREMAGNSVENLDLQQVARDVVKECGGLPIALVTLGRALKDKETPVWEDALVQLRESMPSNITGVGDKVYQSLQLSFKHLESEDARSIFLICCLFQEDFNIPIEVLVRYGMGLQLFKRIYTLGKARKRVHALVDKLRSSYLLLGSEEEGCVKMHDMVRDVGISIGSKDIDHVLMVRHGVKLKELQKEDTWERYTSISLISDDAGSNVEVVLRRKEWPKLELLRLECEDDDSVSAEDDIFEGMRELKVIDLEWLSMPSIPSSVQFLTNLRTLCVHDLKGLKEISIIGELVNLEILSFAGCSELESLPKEIGRLTNLRLLDLRNCVYLKTISFGVISSLVQLEELYIGEDSFKGWVGENEGSNARLRELESLSDLTTLDIHIPDLELLPRNLRLGTKLSKYHISIKERMMWFRRPEVVEVNERRFQRKMYLWNVSEMSRILESGMSTLLKNTELLCLYGCGWENAINELARLGFPHLKDLVACGPWENARNELEYLVNMVTVPHAHGGGVFPILESLCLEYLHNLEEICYGQLPLGSFRQLRYVQLLKCDKLRNLFSLSIARGLVQLQLLDIRKCGMMEEVVYKERGEDGNATNKLEFKEIEFPQLNEMILSELPKLNSFGPKMSRPASEDNALQTLFHQKIKLTGLKKLSLIGMDNWTEIWRGQLQADSLYGLQYLEELEVRACRSVEVVFGFEGRNTEEGHAVGILPCFKSLKLEDVPKLTHIWKTNSKVIQGFENLKSLEMYDCGSLRNVLSPSIAKLLVKLQDLRIRKCEMLEEIVANDEGGGENKEETCIIVLPGVKHLLLETLPNLARFCSDPYTFEWSSLVTLILRGLKMKTFASASLSTQKLKTPNVGFEETLQHHLFNKQIELCSLEVLEIAEMGDLEGIAQDQLPAGSLSKLREISLEKCDILLNVVSSNLLSRLQNLEKLTVDDCKSLVAVFELEGIVQGQLPAGSLSKLREISLQKCDKLLNVVPSNLLSRLQNLEKVTVDDCKSLVAVFELEGIVQDQLPIGTLSKLREISLKKCDKLLNVVPSNLLSRLQNLQRLEIFSCEMMTEIVARDRENGEGEYAMNKIEFPQLKFLELQSLPKLVSFFPRVIVTMASESPNRENMKLIIEGEILPTEQPLFNEEVAFPGLEVLVLSQLQSINRIWCRQLPLGLFCNLKLLYVSSCDSLRNLFSPSMARGLLHLNHLFIEDCKMMEEVVAEEDEEEGRMDTTLLLFLELRYLTLRRLPKLRHFCPVNYALEFPLLTNMEVDGCPEMRSFSLGMGLLSTPKLKGVEVGADDLNNTIQHHLFEGKVAFPRLEQLRGCDGLRNLFSPSMASSLVHLQFLIISDCLLMEEVVAEEKEDGRMNETLFPQLYYLKLKNLPKLRSFCHVTSALEWPLLDHVQVYDCPELMTFSSGSVITPKLKGVKVGTDQTVWMGDLNNTMRHLFKGKQQEEQEKKQEEEEKEELSIVFIQEKKQEAEEKDEQEEYFLQ